VIDPLDKTLDNGYGSAAPSKLGFAMKFSAFIFFVLAILSINLMVPSTSSLASERPTDPMHDYPPFNSNVHNSGDSSCYIKLPCEGSYFTYQEQKNFLNTANKCIQDMFGFPEDFFEDFETYGSYENCTTTSKYIDGAKGTNQSMWATCCLEQTSPTVAQCQFKCYIYGGDNPIQ
jgi:hypothetical protein